MIILKLVIHGVGETIVLRYKNNENGRAAYEKLMARSDDRNEVIDIEDQFGVAIRVVTFSVMTCVKINFEDSMKGDALFAVEKQKIQQREVARLQAASPILTPEMAGLPSGLRMS